MLEILDVWEGCINPSLMIATPTYDGNFCHEYVTSLMGTLEDLRLNGVEYQVEFAVKDEFIHRARNRLVDKFLKSSCTHLLMIDADQGWDPKAPIKMLSRARNFIAGAVPKKAQEEDYAVKVFTDENRIPLLINGDLIKTLMVGAAFTLTNKFVYLAMRNDEIKRKEYHSYYDDTYDEDGNLTGEDVTFCNRWKATGGEILIMPDIDFTHGGHKGNYHKFLMRQPK